MLSSAIASTSTLAFPLLLAASAVAQSSSPSVVCVAGQCLQGFSNLTIGAKLTASNAPTSILLLPGQYTSTTNPQLLHSILTSSSASLSPSPGFGNASSSAIALPLNLALEPGLAIYSDPLYSGQSAFSQLPTTPLSGNSSTPLPANSIALSSNVWAAISSGSANQRIVLWDSIPDVAQLPLSGAGSSSSLTLLDIQASTCSPPCAASGVCNPSSNTCTCPPNFTGASCEACAAGFFGPSCQACPAGCTSCDEGISGSGRCLTITVANAPATCNCLNGVCGANGQCTCNPGWTANTNGTACAQCSDGFFETSTGDCQVCQLGCASCASPSGTCTTCKSGFTQDANDPTKCNAVPSVTTSGTVCPSLSFSSGAQCTACSPSCRTCTGATSNDCILCASGTYSLNGSCVPADANGVCQGSNLIADNNKNECDACGAKCTTCKIPNFSVVSTVNQLQCTGCLPGSFLSQGKCIESCPQGTFVDPKDNQTCTTCDSTCATCAGSSTFCLSCPSNQLASGGKCVSTCPSGTFSSNTSTSSSTPGTCTPCHPDCTTCTGLSFTQCSTCPSSRPALTSGRCLPTCSKAQFLDPTSSTCQACDSSCSSCAGAGPSKCLACASTSQVLKAGTCVASSCGQVLPGLGVCLTDVVRVPTVSGTDSAAPLPSITGVADPTVITTSTKRPLEWWEILLMALGCAFIFVMVLLCWRRRARRKRAKETREFASKKRLDGRKGWWVRFGERLFGHRGAKGGRGKGVVLEEESEDIKLKKLRDAEEARRHTEELDDVEKFIDAYDYSRKSVAISSRRAPSTLPSLSDRDRDRRRVPPPRDPAPPASRLSSHSMYSELTGVPRQTPEPRQPIKKDPMASRFSMSTFRSASTRPAREVEETLLVDLADDSRDRVVLVPVVPPLPGWAHAQEYQPPTEAERYVMAVRPGLLASPPAAPPPPTVGSYWMQPTPTGSSSGTGGSRNPFRQ